jgi:hypothetical protein
MLLSFIQVNNHIAQKAAILHRNDLAMEKHSVFFDLVRESIKNTSAMDTVGWSAIKLATAAVMMCYPEKIPEACDRSKVNIIFCKCVVFILYSGKLSF